MHICCNSFLHNETQAIFIYFNGLHSLVFTWYHQHMVSSSPLSLHTHISFTNLNIFLFSFFDRSSILHFSLKVIQLCLLKVLRVPMADMIIRINSKLLPTSTRVIKIILSTHILCILMKIQLLCWLLHY